MVILQKAGMKSGLTYYGKAKGLLQFLRLTIDWAFGVIKTLGDEGFKVPEDFAVVGFDDIPFAAHFCPPLTTVRQPSTEMGRRGAELLLRAIKGRNINNRAKHTVFEPRLIIRKSARPKEEMDNRAGD